MALPAQAGMITTQAAANSNAREQIAVLLQAHGVSAPEATARVAALSDQEAAELAARIDRLPAGGTGIIEAILVVFLVLLLTDILGFTKVFPFTRQAR
jgi:hypothetical protein